MVIKYRMYPYPVLSSFTDDYTDSKFEVAAESIEHGYDRKLYFQAKLNNNGLQQLINNGKAHFVYHLECSQTGFRKIMRTSDKMCEYLISHHDVCGKLQICPFIVASENIADYTNPAFHSDYDGASFNIEAGCVLAIAPQCELIIDKEIDDLAKIPSIFSIYPIVDTNTTWMTVEINGPRILIGIPLEDYQKYALIDKGTMLTDTLNSMVLIPTLIFTLEEVKHTPLSERYHFEDDGCKWYTTIKRVLSEKFNCDIETSAFDSANIFELAQRMIEEPLHKSLDSLLTLGSQQNGDVSE